MTLPQTKASRETRRREAFASAAEALARELRRARQDGRRVRLAKRDSNLFRTRRDDGERRLDVTAFDAVIAVDPENRAADVGGMTPYDSLVAATLPHGLMPAVVPELKSITVGGAVTGGGVESSSFRHGYVHETVREMDILTPRGELLHCRPDNARADLFHGFPNSYGTLGYALRLRIDLIPASPAVRLRHRRFTDPAAFYAELESLCRAERAKPEGAPFIEAVAFDEHDLVLSVGEWSDDPRDARPRPIQRPHYRSLREKTRDAFRTEDYLWRWDADWFWCARPFGAECRPLRFLLRAFGCLNSRFYGKLRRLYRRSPRLQRLGPAPETEWVIQDVEIPADRAAEFHTFLCKNIGILPFWICPAMARAQSPRYPLFATDPSILYINFGFWGGVPADSGDPAHFNRLVEAKVEALGGMKSLYSDAYFDRDVFWRHYDGETYRALKSRYDPNDDFPDLYEKAVLRH